MDTLNVIQTAASRRVLLLFYYNEVAHVVEPYSIGSRYGRPYLYAYCVSAASTGAHRYMIDRIADASVSTAPYRARFPVELQ